MKITLREVEPPGKHCGGCTLCCKVLHVETLAKPAGAWCPHARRARGCAIYDARPPVCRDFRCLWLTTPHMPDALRPDRVHGVLLPTDDGRGLALHEDDGYAGRARELLRPLIETFIADGQHYVVVISGKQRTFIGDLRLLPADARVLL